MNILRIIDWKLLKTNETILWTVGQCSRTTSIELPADQPVMTSRYWEAYATSRIDWFMIDIERKKQNKFWLVNGNEYSSHVHVRPLLVMFSEKSYVNV